MTEIPLTIKGEMGTIIPIKIEVSPETADVVQAVIGIMDQNVGADKAYLDTPQIEDAADEAMTQIPADMPQMKSASDKISDETVGIISKDQELLADMRAKMDDIEARVSENEHVLGLAGEEEYIEPDPGTGPEGAPELIQDPETGLLFDPETGEIYDPKTGEIIKEELHREYRTQTILEALAVKKATKSIRENYNSYNRDLSIVGGINSLIILEAFDHVFGRTTSYAVLKNRLNIK
jgi:fructose-specific component phosphotransferase system IIB-like protein